MNINIRLFINNTLLGILPKMHSFVFLAIFTGWSILSLLYLNSFFIDQPFENFTVIMENTNSNPLPEGSEENTNNPSSSQQPQGPEEPNNPVQVQHPYIKHPNGQTDTDRLAQFLTNEISRRQHPTIQLHETGIKLSHFDRITDPYMKYYSLVANHVKIRYPEMFHMSSYSNTTITPEFLNKLESLRENVYHITKPKNH